MRTYRALAALLSYPTPELIAALPELGGVLQGHAAGLLEELSTAPLLELEERYVALFDRSRALSLHLFEHVHGESRERGQAMVDLAALYEARGLTIAEHELPDYIPAFLEYLSLLDESEARELLQETAEIMRAIGDRLAERGSRYAEVFAALLKLAGERGLTKAIAKRAAQEESQMALDAQWMDPQVTFGGNAGGNEPQPIRLYRNGVPA
jgi:nitrate reductase molybdenum cofactor assembly chaperone NarJ/NarW